MKRLAAVLGVVALIPILSGCAAPVVAGITLGTLSTIVSAISVGTTGKDLGDHTISALSNKDCNLTEGLLRSDRDICEPENSLATVDDFQGVFAFFGGDRTDPLTRFARARQQEMNMAPAEYVVAMERQYAPTGLPARGGNPAYVKINGRLVYAMAPVYNPADDAPAAAAVPAPKSPKARPRPKPKSKERESYPSLRTASLVRSR